ncbi:hypothetical protein BH09PAT1_BH09PAT1_2940 [soil metagenome]
MLTVGELLYKVRKKRDVTIEDASKATRIQQKYLIAVEKNDWAAFTSKVYISGVIRTYADYLDLDPGNVLAYFRRDYEKKEEVKFRRKLPSLNFLPGTRRLVIGAFTMVVFFFLTYFGFQFYLFLSPPEVQILAPKQDTFRNTQKISIIGHTQKESRIKIFNEDIFPDEQGLFQYEYPLHKGKNPIEIHVTGANGKETLVKKEYVLE